MSTITAANSVFMLAIGGIFAVPQQLQGYAADAAFAFDSVAPAETVMGVDGRMSAGWVPYPTIQTITLMPDSPSMGMFDAWLTSQSVAREVFFGSATIVLPAIGKKYTLNRGVLTAAKTAPDVGKVLKAVEYKITWESVSQALV